MLALSKSRVEKILGGLGVDANVEVLGDVDAWIDSAASAAERELLQWEKLEADADEAARAAETATDDVAGLLRARDEAAATKLGAFGAELAKYEEGRAARDAARAKQQNVVRMMKAGAAAKKGDSAAVQMELTVGLLRAQLLKRGGAEARKAEISEGDADTRRAELGAQADQLAEANAAAAAMVEEAEAARAAAGEAAAAETAAAAAMKAQAAQVEASLALLCEDVAAYRRACRGRGGDATAHAPTRRAEGTAGARLRQKVAEEMAAAREAHARAAHRRRRAELAAIQERLAAGADDDEQLGRMLVLLEESEALTNELTELEASARGEVVAVGGGGGAADGGAVDGGGGGVGPALRRRRRRLRSSGSCRRRRRRRSPRRRRRARVDGGGRAEARGGGGARSCV